MHDNPTADGPRRSEPRWVDTRGELDAVIAELLTVDEYALDTEFHGERTYYPTLALLQIAWPNGLALIDPLAVDITPLGAVFDTDAVMVVHAGDQDMTILQRAIGRLPRRIFDTQIAAGFCGLGTPSLLNLAEKIVRVELAKGDRLTDWTKRPLSDAQRRYAAGDVEYLLSIADGLRRRLTQSGRLAWAEGECDERLRRDRERPDPRTAWWKIKGHRQLRGKARGVAQEVAAWRELRAEARDIPTRFVVSDMALAGIIARAPRTRDDLASIRGIDGRLLRDDVAPEILGAVERGAALEPDALVLAPRDDNDRSLGPAVTVIAAWLSQRASELDLEASVLASRADLTELVNTGAGRLASGWRASLVGEPIEALLHGRAVLGLTDGGRRLELRSDSR